MQTVYLALGALFAILVVRLVVESVRLRMWTRNYVFGVTVVILPNLTLAVATLTNGYVVTTDASFNRVVEITGPAVFVNEIASPLVAALAFLILVVSLRRSGTINTAALMFAVFLLFAGAAAAMAGGALITGSRAAALATIIACIFLPRTGELLRGVAMGLALFFVAGLLAVAPSPEHAAPPCDPRKCGVLGSLFTGIADNNNSLGLMAALAIPVMWFGMHRYRGAFASLALFVALASGSRTAQAAAVMAFVAVVMLGWRPTSRVVRGTVIFATGIAASFVIIVPNLQLSDAALTGRPSLWQLAREYSAENPLLGYGPEVWRTLVDIGVIPRSAGYATHNQAMEILFVAGWVGAAVMTSFFIALVRQNRFAGAEISALLLPVAVCGIAERPWSFGGLDWMFWSIIVVITASFPDAVQVPTKTSASSPNAMLRASRPHPRPEADVDSRDASPSQQTR